MRPALDPTVHRVPQAEPTCLHFSEAPQGIDLSRSLFTCTNANQATTCTYNTWPSVSPRHIVNHSSQPGATNHRSSDAPILSNVTNNTVNAANVQANTAANPRQNARAQPPLVQANRAEGSQHQCIRYEVEIAQRANYDHDHRVPDALNANNPIQAT
jgi:hypothetical protein